MYHQKMEMYRYVPLCLLPLVSPLALSFLAIQCTLLPNKKTMSSGSPTRPHEGKKTQDLILAHLLPPLRALSRGHAGGTLPGGRCLLLLRTLRTARRPRRASASTSRWHSPASRLSAPTCLSTSESWPTQRWLGAPCGRGPVRDEKRSRGQGPLLRLRAAARATAAMSLGRS
jgi:hypothetical protein